MSVEDTWARRELPILLAAYRLVEAGGSSSVSQMEALRQQLSMDARDFQRGIQALANAHPPYLEVDFAAGWSDEKAGGGIIDDVTERGRRELGAWPSPELLVDQLAAALRRAADEETEPDRKGRLRQAADVLGGIAREVAVNVISARIGTKV